MELFGWMQGGKLTDGERTRESEGKLDDANNDKEGCDQEGWLGILS